MEEECLVRHNGGRLGSVYLQEQSHLNYHAGWFWCASIH